VAPGGSLDNAAVYQSMQAVKSLDDAMVTFLDTTPFSE